MTQRSAPTVGLGNGGESACKSSTFFTVRFVLEAHSCRRLLASSQGLSKDREDPRRLLEPPEFVKTGSGMHALQFAEQVGPKGRVLCRDIDPEALETLQEKLAEADLPHVDAGQRYVIQGPVPGMVLYFRRPEP